MATYGTPSPMEGGKQLLFLTLQKLGIETETVPYREKPHRSGMKGVFCKNIFLKDRRGQFYLVICCEDKSINMKHLKTQVGAYRNFSFGTEVEMHQKLGVVPGGVTPFGVLFDTTASVTLVIDQDLATSESQLNFHPFEPKETTLLKFEQLKHFLNYTGHNFLVLEMS